MRPSRRDLEPREASDTDPADLALRRAAPWRIPLLLALLVLVELMNPELSSSHSLSAPDSRARALRRRLPLPPSRCCALGALFRRACRTRDRCFLPAPPSQNASVFGAPLVP